MLTVHEQKKKQSVNNLENENIENHERKVFSAVINTHFCFWLFVKYLNFSMAIICELITMKTRKGQRHIVFRTSFLLGQFVSYGLQCVEFTTWSTSRFFWAAFFVIDITQITI